MKRRILPDEYYENVERVYRENDLDCRYITRAVKLLNPSKRTVAVSSVSFKLRGQIDFRLECLLKLISLHSNKRFGKDPISQDIFFRKPYEMETFITHCSLAINTFYFRKAHAVATQSDLDLSYMDASRISHYLERGERVVAYKGKLIKISELKSVAVMYSGWLLYLFVSRRSVPSDLKIAITERMQKNLMASLDFERKYRSAELKLGAFRAAEIKRNQKDIALKSLLVEGISKIDKNYLLAEKLSDHYPENTKRSYSTRKAHAKELRSIKMRDS